MIKNQLGGLFQQYIDYRSEGKTSDTSEFRNVHGLVSEFDLLAKEQRKSQKKI